MKEDILIVYRVSFSIGEREILKDITFNLQKGEVLQIIGERGSGKTAILKICVGLLKPHLGEVILFDTMINKADYKNLKEVRKKIGVVFQEPTPINNISIFENVALPLRYHYNINNEEINKKVNEMLEKFRIGEYSEVRPTRLDTGESVKLDLARAFVMEPEIIFLDDPFSKLRLTEKIEVLKIFQEEKEKGKTFFVISNEKTIFQNFSSYAILIEEGKVSEYGRTQDLEERIIQKNIFE